MSAENIYKLVAVPNDNDTNELQPDLSLVGLKKQEQPKKSSLLGKAVTLGAAALLSVPTDASKTGIDSDLDLNTNASPLVVDANPESAASPLEQNAELRTLLFQVAYIQSEEMKTQLMSERGRISRERFGELIPQGAEFLTAQLDESLRVAEGAGYKEEEISQGFDLVLDQNDDLAIIPTLRINANSSRHPENSLLAPYVIEGQEGIIVLEDQDGADGVYSVDFMILGEGRISPDTRALPVLYYNAPDGEKYPTNSIIFNFEELGVRPEVVSVSRGQVSANSLNLRDVVNGEVRRTVERGAPLVIFGDKDNNSLFYPDSSAPNASFAMVVTPEGEIMVASWDLIAKEAMPKVIAMPEVSSEAESIIFENAEFTPLAAMQTTNGEYSVFYSQGVLQSAGLNSIGVDSAIIDKAYRSILETAYASANLPLGSNAKLSGYTKRGSELTGTGEIEGSVERVVQFVVTKSEFETIKDQVDQTETEYLVYFDWRGSNPMGEGAIAFFNTNGELVIVRKSILLNSEGQGKLIQNTIFLGPASTASIITNTMAYGEGTFRSISTSSDHVYYAFGCTLENGCVNAPVKIS